MGYISPPGYCLQSFGIAFDPADSLTYYSGQNFNVAPATTATYAGIKIPQKGRITKVCVQIVAGTIGTNENITVNIRINNTTSYLVQTVGAASEFRNFVNYSMNVPVVEGDYIEIEMVSPIWVTNPLQIRTKGSIYITTG